MTSPPRRTSTNQAVTCWTLHDRFRCVSIAPLATPVVPPVYCSSAVSSIAIAGRGRSGAVCFMRLRIRCTPGPGLTDARSGGSARRSRSGASRFSGNRRKSGIEAMT